MSKDTINKNYKKICNISNKAIAKITISPIINYKSIIRLTFLKLNHKISLCKKSLVILINKITILIMFKIHKNKLHQTITKTIIKITTKTILNLLISPKNKNKNGKMLSKSLLKNIMLKNLQQQNHLLIITSQPINGNKYLIL